MRAHYTLGENKQGKYKGITDRYSLVLQIVLSNNLLFISWNELWIGLSFKCMKIRSRPIWKWKKFHGAQITFDLFRKWESTLTILLILRKHVLICVTEPVTLSHWATLSNWERKNIMAEGERYKMIIWLMTTICLMILGAEKCKGIRINSSSNGRFVWSLLL